MHFLSFHFRWHATQNVMPPALWRLPGFSYLMPDSKCSSLISKRLVIGKTGSHSGCFATMRQSAKTVKRMEQKGSGHEMMSPAAPLSLRNCMLKAVCVKAPHSSLCITCSQMDFCIDNLIVLWLGWEESSVSKVLAKSGPLEPMWKSGWHTLVISVMARWEAETGRSLGAY